MGNQQSEMKAEYNGLPGIREKYHFEDTFTPEKFLLNDHHHEGPSKYGEGSSQNPKLQAKPFYVRDRGILTHLDPYLSTTHKDHRSFKPTELRAYPKKDIPTYWDCEEYTKAWGHGNKNKGLKSEYDDHYVKQDHVRQKENYYCAVDTPYVLPQPGSKSTFTAPKMYNTEYQHIGSQKPVTV
nr:hypothetical protein BaRGS_033559 [Batillaria attramentaria]